jgi:hypothetical protein
MSYSLSSIFPASHNEAIPRCVVLESLTAPDWNVECRNLEIDTSYRAVLVTAAQSRRLFFNCDSLTPSHLKAFDRRGMLI